MEEKQSILKAGYAERVITPPLGLPIPGYYHTRLADGIINDLHVRAVAFDNGDTRAIIFMCDALNVRESGYKEVARLVKEACGVEENCVYLHGTHSHTAIYVGGDFSSKDLIQYRDWLFLQFRDAAVEAFEDLKPATISTAKGEAENVGFMRRYELKNGNFRTNPPIGSPDILRPAGTQDKQVQLIRIQREEAKEILIVNFGTHPDTLGGTKYYADWPGFVVDFVKMAFDNKVEALCLNGCQGNSGSVNRMAPKDAFSGKSVLKAEKMARIITGEVLKIYYSAIPMECNTIAGFKEIAKIGKNPYDPEDIPIAQEVRDLYRKVGNSSAPELKPYKEKYNMSVPKAVRILANLNRPEFFEIPVSGLQIGGLAFIGIPGEPFCEIGINIKKESKMDVTFVNCCTNGSFGYYPTKEAFGGDGYERDTSPFAHNCADILVETGLKIISQMSYEK